ncbi:hypothetical protein SYNPS1DRAFT_28766 [Syncephalis pseudoplumigaleata]|uniref:RING-type domain-containing protein n=1 Tax=Syncephalis pseudoplumigaleata TaxID=1712513 RepID=A0A4P9Z230_9FUNG|nr:hypothetical protein SYNPS1DRAFT_28766 [Syncephalis pseudoplumigaleata]|eukprot:RKP25500.1 hypothetical protein SYNPS1DRAFT_28766 [Syncephalis pseudoplumigaleata]
MDKPVFIKGLLDGVGSHVEPLKLVGLIPEGMEIPGLKDGLTKILQDFALQASLQEDCSKILASHIIDLGYQQLSAQRQGRSCSHSMVNVLFFCGHAFHEFCLFDSSSYLADVPLSLPNGGVSHKADAVLGLALSHPMHCPQCTTTTLDGPEQAALHGSPMTPTPSQAPLHQLPPVEQLDMS